MAIQLEFGGYFFQMNRYDLQLYKTKFCKLTCTSQSLDPDYLSLVNKGIFSQELNNPWA